MFKKPLPKIGLSCCLIMGVFLAVGCNGTIAELPKATLGQLKQQVENQDISNLNSLKTNLGEQAIKIPMSAKAIEVLEKKGLPAGLKLLRLYINVPRDPARTIPSEAFSLLSLPVNSIEKIKAELTGLGLSAPLRPEGADANGYLSVASTGTVVVDFLAPVGENRLVTVTGYAAGDYEIAGSTIKGVLDILPDSVSNTSLDFQTTPTAQVIENIMNSNPLMASLVDETALQDFIDNQLTRPLSSTQPITFQSHPTLVNTDVLTQSILNLNAAQPPGSPVQLPDTATWDMLNTPKSLRGTVNFDSAYTTANFTVTVFDPASSSPGYSFNGSFSSGSGSISYLVPGITPTQAGRPWFIQLTATAGGSKSYSGTTYKTIDFSQFDTVDFFVY